MLVPSCRPLWLAVLAALLAMAAIDAASSQSRPKTYCQCIQRCEAGKERCERNFDAACADTKTPRPANCDASFRKRCDQGAGLCNLDCSTAFRATAC